MPWRTGGWNDGKGLGRMLDILWFGGQITIVGARGTSACGTLPRGGSRRTSRAGGHARSPTRSWSAASVGSGVARPGQFGRMFDGVPPGADAAWTSLVREGVAVPARVEGLDGDWWAHP